MSTPKPWALVSSPFAAPSLCGHGSAVRRASCWVTVVQEAWWAALFVFLFFKLEVMALEAILQETFWWSWCQVNMNRPEELFLFFEHSCWVFWASLGLSHWVLNGVIIGKDARWDSGRHSGCHVYLFQWLLHLVYSEWMLLWRIG